MNKTISCSKCATDKLLCRHCLQEQKHLQSKIDSKPCIKQDRSPYPPKYSSHKHVERDLAIIRSSDMITYLDTLKKELFHKMDKKIKKYSEVISINTTQLKSMSVGTINKPKGPKIQEVIERVGKLEANFLCWERMERRICELENRMNILECTFESRLRELLLKLISSDEEGCS